MPDEAGSREVRRSRRRTGYLRKEVGKRNGSKEFKRELGKVEERSGEDLWKGRTEKIVRIYPF